MHTGGTQTATCITPPVLYLGGQGVPSHNHLFIAEASRVGAKSGHAEHLILKLAKVTAQAEMGNHNGWVQIRKKSYHQSLKHRKKFPCIRDCLHWRYAPHLFDVLVLYWPVPPHVLEDFLAKLVLHFRVRPQIVQRPHKNCQERIYYTILGTSTMDQGWYDAAIITIRLLVVLWPRNQDQDCMESQAYGMARVHFWARQGSSPMTALLPTTLPLLFD